MHNICSKISTIWEGKWKMVFHQTNATFCLSLEIKIRSNLIADSSAVRRLFVRLAGAVGRQSALHKENSGFAGATMRRHISTFRGYRILFSIRNSYINRLHQSFFYSFITILPSESGVTLHYSTIFP
jgi:hypothetical protein